MENKKQYNTAIVVLLMISMVIIGILVGYIIFGLNNDQNDVSDSKPNIDSNVQNNNEYNDVTQNFNLNNVEKELNNLPHVIACMDEIGYNTNLFAIQSNRLLLTKKFIPENLVKYTESATVQSSAYLSYSEFEKVYNKLFGNNYSLVDDLKNASNVYEKADDNIYWNPTFLCLEENNYTVNNIYYNDLNKYYLIKGNYKQGNEEQNIEERTGNFELVFNKEENSYSIVSLIIKFN